MLNTQKQIISSYLNWWQDAGQIDAICDHAQPWVERNASVNARPVAPPPISAAPVPRVAQMPMPATLEAFDIWLRSPENIAFSHWSIRPVLPAGPENPDLMLLGCFPDEADIAASSLFSGAHGALLDGMLNAIGLERGQQRLASLAFTRPPTSQLSDDQAQILMHIAHHHIALVQPKVLILVGQQICRIFSGQNSVPAAEAQPLFNHISSRTNIFAVHAMRMLIERPQLKRHAWEVLKRVRELI
ncbi:MAG: uracil-DNA glycosylase family protein [Sphingopyxis sp.]